MLLSSLQHIEKNLKNKNIMFNNEQREIFFEFFQGYQLYSIINPYNLVTAKNFNEEKAIKIFTCMVEEYYLRAVYKIICPSCNTINMKIYESFDEIKNDFLCPKCETLFEEIIDIDLKKIKVLYKVVKL